MENSLEIESKPNFYTNNDLMQLLVSIQIAQMSQQQHLQQQQQQNQASNVTLRNILSLYMDHIQMINTLNSASNSESLNNNLINNSSSKNGQIDNSSNEFDNNFNSNRKLSTLKKEKSSNESKFNYSQTTSTTSFSSFKTHDKNDQTKASKDDQFVPYKKRRFNVACDDQKTTSSYSSECAVNNQEELVNSIKQLAPEHQHKKSDKIYLEKNLIQVIPIDFF